MPETVVDGDIARACGGERGAQERVLAWIGPLVRRTCAARLKAPAGRIHSVEDLGQEILLSVQHAFPRLRVRTTAGLLSLAKVIARRAVADHVRDRHGRLFEANGGAADDAALLARVVVEGSGPRTKAERADLVEAVLIAMSELRRRDRDLLDAVFFRFQQSREIAAELGTTRNTVSMRVQRALGRLRELLARPGAEPTNRGG